MYQTISTAPSGLWVVIQLKRFTESCDQRHCGNVFIIMIPERERKTRRSSNLGSLVWKRLELLLKTWFFFFLWWKGSEKEKEKWGGVRRRGGERKEGKGVLDLSKLTWFVSPCFQLLRSAADVALCTEDKDARDQSLSLCSLRPNIYHSLKRNRKLSGGTYSTLIWCK